MTAPSHVDVVIQDLSRDQSLTRIKKLLLYLCSNHWENQPARLDAVDLHYLVQEILKTTPELKTLEAKLNKVVRSINKPAEYALVANAIVGYLKPLYANHQEATQVVLPNNSYTATTTLLEQNPQSIRIQKILFCACNGRWENDLNALNHYPLNGLVERLHTLTPSIEELRAVLFSIVKTLNRQAEYTLVANSVLEAFTPLYLSPVDSTHILSTPEVDHVQWSAPTSSSIAHSRPTQPVDLASRPEELPSEEPVAELPKEPPDRFDLRLEVMKYTSPLRAKALLFSMLYRSIDATNEGWSVVRSHDLDELLQTTLDTYTTYESLEVALKNTAKALNDAKPYLQSASAMLRAVRSWYDYIESSNAESGNAKPSNPSLDTPQPPVRVSPPAASQPPTAPVNLRPLKTKSPISPSQGDRTLDLTPPSIHQDKMLSLPETPSSTPLSQEVGDTGFFSEPSEQP